LPLVLGLLCALLAFSGCRAEDDRTRASPDK
jgi:hypothetical protein